MSVVPVRGHFITPQKSWLFNHFCSQFVCLSFCSFVNGITQTNGPILIKFGIMTDDGIRKNPMNDGLDPKEILSVSVLTLLNPETWRTRPEQS